MNGQKPIEDLEKKRLSSSAEVDGGTLDGLEQLTDAPQAHRVPDNLLEDMDRHIARSRAERHSTLDPDKAYEWDDVHRQLKGDIGEGYTYTDLLDRYDAERIVPQPEGLQAAEGRPINPDAVVTDPSKPGQLAEIVDAKAWAPNRPRDADGKPIAGDDYMRYLFEQPAAGRLLNMGNLQDVVHRYSSCPQLAPDGRVVLYLPNEVSWQAPQVVQEIQGWSGTEIAHGRPVEVRFMSVENRTLWAEARRRHAGPSG